ncbi:MAG: dihydrodipicolinate synthase family protein [Candidatus Micrarchaeales archaeon]|jgi:dihydrodipicolinate synthase/N-acetylneuraminate lyase|nr:dihydrodipicolinate synthase family protein [Candidatus Micrarchaeales archaeon]
MGPKKLCGIITPTITPLKNGRLDSKAISKLSEFVSKTGASGIFPAGSTGCFPFLDMEQHKSVITEFSEYLDGRLMLLPGVGRNSISETMEVARHASKLGADALVIVSPYYIKLDDGSMFRYFDKIAGSTGEKIILYNIPQFTGNEINVKVALALAKKHSNIIGIKDSSGNFRSIAAFINSMPRGFSVFQGEDDLLLPSLMLGASGCVCGTTNFSDLAVQVYKKFKEGEINSASQLQSRLDAVMGAVNSVQFPSGYCFAFSKFVMRGAEVGCVPPIGKPSPKEKASIYSQLKGMF